MPAEPSPQRSKTPLLLTSHLYLDPPNTLLRLTFIFTHLSFPSTHYMSSLTWNIQYNYKALHYTLFSIICCFILFGSDYLAYPFALEHAQCMIFHLLCGSQPHIHIKFHGADIVLISGFCHSAHEVYALLGCYTSWLGVGYLHFGTTYQSHHHVSSTKTLENGTDRFFRNVGN